MYVKILVINCGSTSTKLAIFDGETMVYQDTERLPALLAKSMREDPETNLEHRKEGIRKFLENSGLDSSEISGVAARGGAFYPVRGGAYMLDDALEQALWETMDTNPDNCSGILGKWIAEELGVPAVIYDAVTVDELIPVARYSGAKGYDRYSRTHTLNTRAMAIEAASEEGLDYREMNIITAHLGGGVSVNIFRKGRIVDVVTSEEGGFSAERCGGLQGDTILEILREKGVDYLEALMHGSGGLISYFGTNDAKEIQDEISKTDPDAVMVLEAMGYQVAKAIGSMAAVVEGNVDLIVLTGGMLYSDLIAESIRKRVQFIAPVKVKPGEKEMFALAQGAIRVLENKEEARRFPPGAKEDIGEEK